MRYKEQKKFRNMNEKLILSFKKLLLFLQFSFTFLWSQLLTTTTPNTQETPVLNFVLIIHSFSFLILQHMVVSLKKFLSCFACFWTWGQKIIYRVYFAPRLPGFWQLFPLFPPWDLGQVSKHCCLCFLNCNLKIITVLPL